MDLKISVDNVLLQLSSMLEQVDQNQYKKPVETLHKATLGQHTRHIIEFFVCLMEGYSSGIVNYDNRKRDKLIEENKSVALDFINKIKFFVSTLKENTPLTLSVSYDLSADHTHLIETNYHRELAYNIEHAIHHMAIIKIGLKELCPEKTIPADFGVASSTIKYQHTQSN